MNVIRVGIVVFNFIVLSAFKRIYYLWRPIDVKLVIGIGEERPCAASAQD